MLYAMEVTRVGGHTLFANMYDAWYTLPDDLKTKIDGRKVLHIYKYLPTERVDLTDDISKYDHQWRPIVITPKIRPPGALRQRTDVGIDRRLQRR